MPRKVSPDQQPLGFEWREDEALALIKLLTPDNTGCGPKLCRQVRELLIKIWSLSSHSAAGWHGGRRLLAKFCHCSLPTVTRHIRAARELGVLSVQGDPGKRQTYRVNFAMIRKVAAAARVKPDFRAADPDHFGPTDPDHFSENDQGFDQGLAENDQGFDQGIHHIGTKGTKRTTGTLPTVEKRSQSQWGVVKERLKMELGNWKPVLDCLQSSQLSPEEVLDLLNYYRTVKEKLPADKAPGILYNRLLNAAPDEDPSLGWPLDAETVAIQTDRDRRRQQSKRLSDAATVAEKEFHQEQEQREELEAKYGPQLDSFPKWKRRKLARQVLPLLLVDRYRDDETSPMCRQLLLEHLRDNSVDSK